MQKVDISGRGLQIGLRATCLFLGLLCSRTVHEYLLGTGRQNGDLWTEWSWIAICAVLLATIVRTQPIVCATLLFAPALALRAYGYTRHTSGDENLLPFVVGLDILITAVTTACFFAIWWICSKFLKPA
jgi:hypothetical protein